MRAPKLLLAAITAFLAGLGECAHAGIIRHDRDPLLYRSLAASPEYASVGSIYLFEEGGYYMASGTLIAPDWVLTAGHVVDGADALTFRIGGGSYAATNWLPHPKWNGSLAGGYDIGLMQLDRPVPDTIAPAARYGGDDELGAAATLVGFGMTGTGQTGAVVLDGLKRAGQNTIDALYGRNPMVPARILLCDFDNPDDPADNSYGSEAPLDLEYLVSFGDSGGGVFMDSPSGAVLAGVHSFVSAPDGYADCDYGDISGHTRVSIFNDWIDYVLGGAVGKPGLGKGRWTQHPKGPFFDGVPPEVASAVPEPASAVLLGLGACLAMLRRSRG